MTPQVRTKLQQLLTMLAMADRCKLNCAQAKEAMLTQPSDANAKAAAGLTAAHEKQQRNVAAFMMQHERSLPTSYKYPTFQMQVLTAPGQKARFTSFGSWLTVSPDEKCCTNDVHIRIR